MGLPYLPVFRIRDLEKAGKPLAGSPHHQNTHVISQLGEREKAGSLGGKPSFLGEQAKELLRSLKAGVGAMKPPTGHKDDLLCRSEIGNQTLDPFERGSHCHKSILGSDIESPPRSEGLSQKA